MYKFPPAWNIYRDIVLGGGVLGSGGAVTGEAGVWLAIRTASRPEKK